MDFFRVLGIEETREENEIKQAYLQKLKTTNPEDDPEGFKRLRKAYEEAVAFARQPEQDEAQQEQQVDDTPSGQWVSCAAKIYGKLSTRTDLEEWKRLFEDESFLALDGEDECREKLLVFLMNHIFLPTPVWKFLDEKLQICSRQEKLKEKFPGDFIRYLVYKCRNGENIDFTLFQGADDADYDGYLNLYNQGWRMLENGDIDGAQDAVTQAQQLEIKHPAMQLLLANIRLKQGQKAETGQLICELQENYPDHMMVTYQVAELYVQMGETKKAKKLYETLKERDDKHYMANFRLTKIYADEGNYKQAKKCAEDVLKFGADDDFISQLQEINAVLEQEYKAKKDVDADAAMEYGWCLIQDEKYFEGIKLVESLEGKVKPDRDAERKGLLAKLYLQEAMFYEAADQALIWREALIKRMETEDAQERSEDRRRLRDSYLIRVEAFQGLARGKKEFYQDVCKELDSFEQILEEDKDADELINSRIRILLKRAEIYLEQEEYDQCEPVCMQLLNDYHIDAAYTLLLRLYAGKRDAGGVIHFGQLAVKSFPQYVRGYEEMALVYLCLKRGENLEAVLKDAESAGVKSVYLDAYEYQYRHPMKENEKKSLKERLDDFEQKYKKPIIERGRIEVYEEGIKELLNIFYQSPSTYMLNEVGRFQMDALHFDEAAESFKKILEEEPGNQFALNNLGCIYKYTAQYEKAIVCLKRAQLYMDDEPNTYPYGNLAHTYERMGENQLAYETYEALGERFPEKRSNSQEDIIHTLTRSGKIELAIRECEKRWPDDKSRMDRLSMEFDIYMEVDDMERCKDVLDQMERAYNPKELEQMSIFREKKASYLILTGQYLEGLKKQEELVRTVQAACPDGVTPGDSTGLAELIAEYLFFLTIYDDAIRQPEQKASGSFLQRIGIFGGKDKKSDRFSASRRDHYFKAGETFRVWLDELLDKNGKGQQRDRYFYRKTYLAYLQFISAYFNPKKDAAAACEAMNHSVLCRMCRDNVCLERMVANALMLERKGDREGAIEVYRKLGQINPFQTESRAKLRYMQ